MSGLCGDGGCASRVRAWLETPDDDLIRDPCVGCLAALADMFGLAPADPPRAMVAVHREVTAEGAAP